METVATTATLENLFAAQDLLQVSVDLFLVYSRMELQVNFRRTSDLYTYVDHE
jgi:hypothetical protein